MLDYYHTFVKAIVSILMYYYLAYAPVVVLGVKSQPRRIGLLRREWV